MFYFLNLFQREREQQGGLFQAEIIFGADDQLAVFPPLHLFQEVLLGAVLSVADSVLQVRSHQLVKEKCYNVGSTHILQLFISHSADGFHSHSYYFICHLCVNPFY